MSDNRLEAGVERSKKRERDRGRDREDERTRSRDSDRGRDSDREREKLRERVGHRSSKGRDSGEFASKLIIIFRVIWNLTAFLSYFVAHSLCFLRCV